MCEGNLIGVQYYGEWRTFRIVQIQSLDGELELSSSSPVKSADGGNDVVQRLSELVLENSMEERDESGRDSASLPWPLGEVPVLKVTARSRMVITSPSMDNKLSKPEVKDPNWFACSCMSQVLVIT